MRRRSIVLLAGGLLALALAPPVFGAGESTTPSPDQSASTTSTTAPYDSGSDSSATPSSTSTTAPSGAGATTTTTAPDQAADSPAPSGNCSEPVQTHEPAPAEGETVIYPAGDAGEVEVSRLSPTELEIVEAVANDGWSSEVTAPSGPRVKARFVETASSNKTRFAAQMDQAGEEIHVRVESCT